MGSFVATGKGVIGGDISGWMSWSGGVSCHTQKNKKIKIKKIDYESCFFFLKHRNLLLGVEKSCCVAHKALQRHRQTCQH